MGRREPGLHLFKMWFATGQRKSDNQNGIDMIRPRFTLRTFVAITTTMGVVIAVYLGRVADQRNAVAAIREVGGTVIYSSDTHEIGHITAWLSSSLGPDFFWNIHRVLVADTVIMVSGPPVVIKDGNETVITCSSARPLSPQAFDASSMFALMKPTESRGRRWGGTTSSGIHLQYNVRCTKSKDGVSSFEIRVQETELSPSGLVTEL